MGSNRAIRVPLAVVAVFLGAASGYASQDRVEDDALLRFRTAVDAYVALHRDVEQHVMPLEISPEARKIHQAVEAMAAAMRAARSSARAGDIFDAATGTLLRTLIRDTLVEHRHDPADLVAAMRDEGEAAAIRVRPTVNGDFVWAQGSFMPPCLLQVLPLLPAELEYRFVDRDLVLVDIHAGLVVDVLLDALPVSDFAVGGFV